METGTVAIGITAFSIGTGATVIYIIADIIVVIYRGRIMGRFPAADADIQQIGLLMVGSGVDDFGAACRV